MFSFKPFWRLLLERDMTKTQMREALGFSPATLAKMSKGEYVSMEVLHKVCEHFGIQVSDVIEYVPDKK
jgi:putative transcriptional regulator